LRIRVKLCKTIKTGGYQAAITIITVEKPLKEKLGDERVDSLIPLLNQSQQNQKRDLMVYLEEQKLRIEESRAYRNSYLISIDTWTVTCSTYFLIV
jgi:hypothetical protein